MFVLKRIAGFVSFEYYLGRTYVFQGYTYAAVTSNLNDSKKYTTKARAEKGAESLNTKCQDVWIIEEIK